MVKFNTLASTIAAVTNAVQLSECVQLAIKNKGSTPLDPMIPPRFRRLAAVLQIPVLIALLAGEVSKVREAFDGEDEPTEKPCLPYLNERSPVPSPPPAPPPVDFDERSPIVIERRGNCVYFSDGEGNPASLL